MKTTARARWRRRVRRVLVGCVLLVGALVLLAALAPAILCSKAVQSRLTKHATGVLGRELVLEGVDFGWRKPVRIGRVVLPPVPGQGELPLADMTGVTVPLSLGRLVSGPPYPLTVEVERLELNLVRAESGELNTFTLPPHAEAGEDAETQSERKTETPTPILPLSSIRFHIRRMDIRYVDDASGLAAAWETGELVLDWSGPGQPLSCNLNGKLLLGDNALPVELSALLESCIDEGGKLTPGAARIRVDSGDLEKGGIQLGGVLQDGGEVFARIRVPLAEVERMRQGLPLPDGLPGLAGDLDFNFSGHHANGFRDWRIRAALGIDDFAIAAAGSRQAGSPPSGTNITLTGGIEIAVDLVGLFPAGGTDPSTHELQGTGLVSTAIQALEIIAGERGLLAEGIFDRRRFSLAMKHGSAGGLSYGDEASTGFEIAEDTTGLVAGGVSVTSEVHVGPAGALAFILTGADLGELLYAGEGMEVMLPAFNLDGALSVDVPSCQIRAKELSFGLSGVLDGRADAAFNWSNTQWRLDSAIAVTNLPQALELVAWEEGRGVVMPSLQGQVDLAAEVSGSLPEGAFDILSPIPLEGVVRMQLRDTLIDDESRGLRLGALDATSELAVSDKGRAVAVELDLEIDDVKVGSGPALHGVQVSASANMNDTDELELTVDRVSVTNLMTVVAARTKLSGLRGCLRPGFKTTSLVALLGEIDLDVDVNMTQELAGLSSVVPGLTGQGVCSLDLSCRNTPGRRLAARLGLDVEDASAGWGDQVKVTGIDGEWILAKSIRHQPSGRRPGRPAAGRVTIDSIHLPMLGTSAEIRDTAIMVQGVDHGLDVNIAVRDLMGGSAVAVCGLTREDDDPVVNARITITGVNGAAFMPDVEFADARAGELHAVADADLRLHGEAQGSLLDALRFRARTIRIGKRAFARLLHAMDAHQQTPQFQNAIAALAVGTPVKAELTMANSLVTFGSDLRLAGGAVVPLPILDHEPIGELVSVFGTDQGETGIQPLRGALLMLLEDDMNEIRAQGGTGEERPVDRDPDVM